MRKGRIVRIAGWRRFVRALRSYRSWQRVKRPKKLLRLANGPAPPRVNASKPREGCSGRDELLLIRGFWWGEAPERPNRVRKGFRLCRRLD